MIASIQAIIISALIAFTAGSGLASYVTYRFFSVAQLQAENSARKAAAKKTADAVHFTEGQDDEADAIEKTNSELIDAIRKKVDDAKTQALSNVQCADPAVLRDIAKIQ